MEFIESLERMTLADKFRRYHPGVPMKQHSKEWLMLFLLFCCNLVLSSLGSVVETMDNTQAACIQFISRPV